MLITGKLVPANLDAFKSPAMKQRISQTFKYGGLMADEPLEGLEDINWTSLQKLDSLRLDVEFKNDELKFYGDTFSDYHHHDFNALYQGEQGALDFMDSIREVMKMPAAKELQISGNFRLSLYSHQAKIHKLVIPSSEYQVNVKSDGAVTYQKMQQTWGTEIAL